LSLEELEESVNLLVDLTEPIMACLDFASKEGPLVELKRSLQSKEAEYAGARVGDPALTLVGETESRKPHKNPDKEAEYAGASVGDPALTPIGETESEIELKQAQMLANERDLQGDLEGLWRRQQEDLRQEEEALYRQLKADRAELWRRQEEDLRQEAEALYRPRIEQKADRAELWRRANRREDRRQADRREELRRQKDWHKELLLPTPADAGD
jgi:hypothetical protein